MVLVWIAASAFAGQEIRVELRAETGALWIDGSLRFDEKPARGDRLDLRRDLGWTDASFVPELGVGISLDRHHFGLSLQTARFRGTAEFDGPTRRNESLFPAGERIRTRISIHEAPIDYRFGIA